MFDHTVLLRFFFLPQYSDAMSWFSVPAHLCICLLKESVCPLPLPTVHHWHMLVKFMNIPLKCRRAFLNPCHSFEVKHHVPYMGTGFASPTLQPEEYTEIMYSPFLQWFKFSQEDHSFAANVSSWPQQQSSHDFLPLNWCNKFRNHLVVCVQTFEGLKLLFCVVACF